MKVVFLARWYPHKYDPMFGLFVQRHAEAAALHNDVSVIYVHPDENAKSRYDIERSKENGVDTLRIYYQKKGRLRSAIRFYQACEKGLRITGHPDLIHVHVLTRMGIVAYWHKIFHGTPYLISEHWSRYLPGNDFSGILRRILTKIVVRNAAMVTTASGMLAKAMQEHGLRHACYKTLPNVVDVDLFKPIAHHNAIPKIVHVSCFEDKSKNISGLLESLKAMKEQGIAYNAVLIGEGMDLEAMRKRSEALGLTDRVRFTGLLQGPALAEEVATGDFFVLSSHYETGGIVLLEAMACGLPVVATRVGGLPEIVNEQNGILVAPNDAHALAEGMGKACHTFSQYDPDLLRKHVVERYSYEKVGNLLSAWYEEVTRPRCSS